eukprot:7154621-Pyramimonas_sp.AAC.1
MARSGRVCVLDPRAQFSVGVLAMWRTTNCDAALCPGRAKSTEKSNRRFCGRFSRDTVAGSWEAQAQRRYVISGSPRDFSLRPSEIIVGCSFCIAGPSECQLAFCCP